MGQYRQELEVYFKKHHRELFLTGFLLVLSLYNFLFTDNYRMDTIIKQVYKGYEFNDMELGRFGIVWFNRLFEMRIHNPYLSGFMTVLALLSSSALLSFMLWKATKGRSGTTGCLLPLVVFLTPNWLEQMYFSYQTFLVLFGVLLTELAVFLTEFSEKKRALIIPVILTFCALAIYQAFAPLYLSLCTGVVLLRCLDREDWSPVLPMKSALRHMAVFLPALAAYTLVNRVVQPASVWSGYLNSQVNWEMGAFSDVFQNMIISIRTILTAGGQIDTLIYSVSALCCIFSLLISLPRLKDKKRAAIVVFGWFILQLAAFSMILLLGGRGYIRTELSITFAAALNILFALLLAKDSAVGENPFPACLPVCLISAACLAAFYDSAGICFRLIYTDDIRYAHDVRLANRVAAQLANTGAAGGQKPVIFVGEPTVTLDASCIKGEVIGRSMFQFQKDEDMTYTLIKDFMATQGVTYPRPDTKILVRANQMSKEMPDFPEKGSVRETGEFVVVKFSDDLYFDLHKLKPGWSFANDALEFRNEGMVCQMEAITTDGLKVRFMGYNLHRGTDAKDLTNTLYLLDQSNGKLYNVNTARRHSQKPTKMFWRDEVNYDAAGFTAELPISLFVQYPDSDFEILVRCDENNGHFLVNTGKIINKRMIDRMPLVIDEQLQR